MRISRSFSFHFLIAGILLSGFFACSKKDQNAASSSADFQSFNFVPGKDIVDIQPAVHRILVKTPNTVSGNQLAANFTLSPGASVTVNAVTQETGVTSNNFDQDLVYTVTAENKQTKINWTVQATNNDNSIGWGLGHFVNVSASENRTYNWYIDQSTSGEFASINCGPASVTMAIRWADSTFTKTALNARQKYRPEGGWWFTTDIYAYLNDYNIPNAIIGLSDTASITKDILKKQLDHQQIVILCLDMNYVRASGEASFHADKFYQTSPDWGHFIVLKGYQQVDGELFFEAFDPFSFGQVYADQSLKGMNRFYRYEDLAAACLPWWNFAFVIAKKGESLSTDAVSRKLDPARVPAAHNY